MSILIGQMQVKSLVSTGFFYSRFILNKSTKISNTPCHRQGAFKTDNTAVRNAMKPETDPQAMKSNPVTA
jgi:hypothetical protein